MEKYGHILQFIKNREYNYVFVMHSIRQFYKLILAGQSLLWTTIMVHDKFAKSACSSMLPF